VPESRSPVRERHPLGLRRAWDGWRGATDLGRYRALPLRVEGGWIRPCPRGIAAARTAGERAPVLLETVAEAVLAHLRAGELDGVPLTRRGVRVPEEVWELVEPCHVGVAHMRGFERVEIGLSVAWDEEHLWGALFHDWRLVELNESVPAIR